MEINLSINVLLFIFSKAYIFLWVSGRFPMEKAPGAARPGRRHRVPMDFYLAYFLAPATQITAPNVTISIAQLTFS